MKSKEILSVFLQTGSFFANEIERNLEKQLKPFSHFGILVSRE